MCTFDLSFNDSLVENIRPFFKDEAAIKEWMQHQMEYVISQFYTSKASTQPQTKTFVHSLSHLRGIGDSSMSIDQLRDEYLKEKYGV